MKKSEFKQYLVEEGKKPEEIIVTIKGAEKLDKGSFPVVLANMLGQASEGNEVVLKAMLMALIDHIAEGLDEETFGFIMYLAELELLYTERED